KKIWIYDLSTGAQRSISLGASVKDAKVILGAKDVLHVLADTNLYAFDSNVSRLLNAYTPAYAGGEIPFHMLSWISDTTFWDRCWATMGKGVYILRKQSGHFRMVSEDMLESRGVGYDRHGNNYWWNNSLKRLVSVDGRSGEMKLVKSD